MTVKREEGEYREANRCGNCDLYSASSQTHGSCEFWKSMDVMPQWMEGERVPMHAVRRDDGGKCEAFIAQNDESGARHAWLLENLTSMN